LAEAADLHPTAISLLERGRRQPSLAVVIRLANVLQIGASELVAEVIHTMPRE
jgi:transcriptional regulator with XRE-family HTH domain